MKKYIKKKKYVKKTVCRFTRKSNDIEIPVNDIMEPPVKRPWLFGDKPTVLSRNRTQRFKDLAALHRTEFIWCTARECMIALQVCFHTCKKKEHCRRYQNYMNGCDKNGKSLLEVI